MDTDTDTLDGNVKRLRSIYGAPYIPVGWFSSEKVVQESETSPIIPYGGPGGDFYTMCSLYGLPEIPADTSLEEFEDIIGGGVREGIKEKRWPVPSNFASVWASNFLEAQLSGKISTKTLREEFKRGIKTPWLLQHLDYVMEEKGMTEDRLLIGEYALTTQDAERYSLLKGAKGLLGPNLLAHWHRESERQIPRPHPFVVSFCRWKSDICHAVGGITDFVDGHWVVRVIDSFSNYLPIIQEHIEDTLSQAHEDLPIWFEHRALQLQGGWGAWSRTVATLYGCNGFAHIWAHELAQGIPFQKLRAPSDLRFIHLRLVTLELDPLFPPENDPCFDEAYLYADFSSEECRAMESHQRRERERRELRHWAVRQAPPVRLQQR